MEAVRARTGELRLDQFCGGVCDRIGRLTHRR
jgi:hypothetical protein